MSDISISIGGDADTLKNNIESADKVVKKFASDVKGYATDILQISAAATAAAAGVFLLAENATAAGREIELLARISNTTAQEFQRIAFGADQFGISGEKLADIMKDVTDRVGDFVSTGGGPMADFFEKIGPKIGVTVEHFKNLSGPDALQLYISSLEKANVNQQEMTFFLEAVASDLVQLQPLFANNGELLKENAAQVDALNLALSDVQLYQLEQGAKAFSVMSQQARMVKNIVGSELSPVIAEFVERMNSAEDAAIDFGEGTRAAISVALRTAGFFGDMMRVVQIALKATQLVGEVAGAALYSAFELVAEAIYTGFIVPLTNGVNAAVSSLNYIPGVDIAPANLSPFMDSINEMGNASRAQISIVAKELRDLSGQKLYSTEIDEFLTSVKERSEEAAEAVTVAKSVMQEKGGSQSAFNFDEEELEKLKEKFLLERELFREHKEELDLIGAEFDESKFESEEEWKSVKEASEKSHQDKLSKLVKSGNASREAFDKLSMKSKAKIITGELTNITAGVAQHNRKLFELNKAAGIAEAIVNAYVGISKTMASYSYPYNLILSAAHAASAFAQIDAIKSASYNGGGGGRAPSSAAVEPVPVTGDGGGGGGGGESSTLFVDGIGADSLFTGDVVRDLAGKLMEHQRNGGEVVFR